MCVYIYVYIHMYTHAYTFLNISPPSRARAVPVMFKASLAETKAQSSDSSAQPAHLPGVGL